MVWSLQQAPNFSDEEFERWNKLLEDRTGIQLVTHQRGFLQIQVASRMRELGVETYGEYFSQLTDGVRGALEWSILVDRLVVKETSYFRHRDSIEYVRQLLQQRINNRELKGNFEVWSLGCATGEEPYSLSMVINDCFELAGLESFYGVTATDISQPALQHARQGIYSARKLESLSLEEKSRYFDLGDSDNFQVKRKLRERVCFSSGNLLNLTQMPMAAMDVIFCQNVLIYFRRWRRREILNELVSRLKPGGVLVIGLGEVVDWDHKLVRRAPDDRIQAYVRCQ